MRRSPRESGQATLEFALIGLILFMLTAGLIDVGRAFYNYNAISVAARYGARWGSVVGGTCSGPGRGGSTSDWCNQLGSGTTDFWNTPGNKPSQGNAACPTTVPSLTDPNYYKVSDYKTSTSTTIVGAVAQKFDTNSGGGLIAGALTPGFDLTQMRVCIQLPSQAYAGGNWQVGPGYVVTVYVYYPFKPVGGLLGGPTLNLIGSSEYQIEGF